MTFNFTEEQVMIRDMVREFTKKEVEPRDKWMDENGFDYELHKKLTQAYTSTRSTAVAAATP